MTSLDSFKSQKTLKVGGKTYVYYSLPTAEKNGLKVIPKLPYSMKVLLENLLRNEDGRTVKKDDILADATWLKKGELEHEIAFRLFFFQAEDGIRDHCVTGVQTCALPI